jgi:hypothetical protein
VTVALAEALVSAGTGAPFREGTVEVLVDGDSAASVLAAVQRAAAAASDVLLLYYAGSGSRHDAFLFGEAGPRSKSLVDEDPTLRTVADVMRDSRAARLVVLLDCDSARTAVSYFTRMTLPDTTSATRTLSLLAPEESSFWFATDSFTETLTEGLWAGVDGGPEVLDLVTLRNAVYAAFTEVRYRVENEYIGAPGELLLHGGGDVALGVNRATLPRLHGLRPLPLNAEIVNEREAY